MHQTRRTIRIRRSGTRTAATAANPAPRPLGKWGRPQSVPSTATTAEWPGTSTSSTSPPRPQSRDWTQTAPVASFRSASTAGATRRVKWASPADRLASQPSDFARTESPLSRPLPRAGQHSLRVDTPPHRASSGRSRDMAPHQAFGNTREAAPHQAPLASRQSSSVPRRPSVSLESFSRPVVSSLAQILRKDRINAELGKNEAHEPESATQLEGVKDITPKPAIRPPIAVEGVEELSGDDPGVRTRARNAKHDRKEFKERGSIVSRFGFSNDITLSKHGRISGTRASEHSVKEKEREKKKAAVKTVKHVNRDVFIPSVVSVGNLAKLLNVRLDTLRRTMIKVGMDAEASYDHMLTSEYASLLAMEFNRNPVVNDEAAFDLFPPAPHPDPSTLPSRPPVVTIMGHVDHGKTTLLDTLRSTSVVKDEAGGITQHIGAFSVPVPGSSSGGIRTITFLDTPGHAAFSAMRARGAGVTDIIVLVVAADDGIMPQTREVIELIRKENASVVVAINKVDKPGVDISKVERALLAEGVQLETFGGDVPSVPVSGLKGQGLDQLVETISAVAEMQDLRAERSGNIQGYVLESKVQKGLGPVATVLILRGCLNVSDHIIAGLSHAKVRVLNDSNGKAVKSAYPGMAVTVCGWKELPKAGDEVLQGTESQVKKALANRIRKAEIEATLGDMEAINEHRRLERETKDREAQMEANGDEDSERAHDRKEEAGQKELRLIIKADVSGSAEAVSGALQGIGNSVARVKIVMVGVGNVTESDITRAKAIDGMVVAFNVTVSRAIQATAASLQVPLLSSSVIYRLMDDVKKHVIALLPPIIEKRVTGEASVLQLFDIQLKGKKTMKVAGCRVTNGVVEKNKHARVVRNGEIIHEGRLETLRHLKKDIMEASKGLECGMSLDGYDDLREGDMIQMYQEVEKPGNL